MQRPTHVPALAALVAKAWKENAPDAKFAGYTVEQFEAACLPASDTRDQLLALDTQRRNVRKQRKNADRDARDAVQRVVSSVRADINFGPNAPLLTAMCFATRDSYKSGLTRKSKASSATVTPAA